MKIKVRYVGKHLPKETIEVREDIARLLVRRGDYDGMVEEEKERPNEKWTEKKIKKWIIDNGIDIKYDIRNDTKKEVLMRLKDAGW